jgi:allantoin racemase
MKIKIVIPNSGMDRETLTAREHMLSRAVSAQVELSVDCISSGPASIESNTDEVMAGPLLIQAARRAEAEGFGAFVVYCFSDLAVPAIRENVSIPVVGPGEVSLAAADMVSNKFSIITTVEGNVSRTYRRLIQNPIAQRKMKSVRALNIPVAELRENPDATRTYLEKVCCQCVKEDGVDTVILGCLGLAQYGGAVEQVCGAKAIDPAFCALAWAELAARLDLRPSRRSVASYGGTL